MRLLSGTGSHVGNVRETNQDRVYVLGEVAALADGMGGHQGGERAAELAIGQFRQAKPEISEDDLVEMILAANRAVHHDASDNGFPGMGTTLVALTLHDDETMTVVNVGDSRAYWIRNGYMNQITEDHSFVEDLVRQGRLTPEEAAVHPQRNILTRAVGIGNEVDVDRFPIEEPEVGDRFLLCSDGLFNELTEDEILAICLATEHPGDAAEALIEATLETPCRDNVTVAVVDVVADDDPRLAAQEDDTLEEGIVTNDYLEDEMAITAPMPVINAANPPPGAEPGDEAGDGEPAAARASTLLLSEDTAELERGPEPLDPVLGPELPEVDGATDVRPRFSATLIVGLVLIVTGLLAGGFFLARAWAGQGYFIQEHDATGRLAVFSGRPDGFFGFFGPEVVVEGDYLAADVDGVDLDEIPSQRYDDRQRAEEALREFDQKLAEAQQEAEDESTTPTDPSDGSEENDPTSSTTQLDGAGPEDEAEPDPDPPTIDDANSGS